MVGIHRKEGIHKISIAEAINADLIKKLETRIDDIQTEKIDTSAITQAQDITVSGYVVDAKELNAEIAGTLANKIEKTNTDMQNAYLNKYKIPSFSSGFGMYNDADGIACYETASGRKKINGLLGVWEGFDISSGILFTVPEKFKYDSPTQAWFTMNRTDSTETVILRMAGKNVCFWGNVAIKPGIYVIDFSY